MADRSLVLRLTDMIERIRSVIIELRLEEFETDWQQQWLVERGVQIISEGEPSPERRS